MEFLEKVEQSGKWPQQTCTTMFFVIPKNVRAWSDDVNVRPVRVPEGRHEAGAVVVCIGSTCSTGTLSSRRPRCV